MISPALPLPSVSPAPDIQVPASKRARIIPVSAIPVLALADTDTQPPVGRTRLFGGGAERSDSPKPAPGRVSFLCQTQVGVSGYAEPSQYRVVTTSQVRIPRKFFRQPENQTGRLEGYARQVSHKAELMQCKGDKALGKIMNAASDYSDDLQGFTDQVRSSITLQVSSTQIMDRVMAMLQSWNGLREEQMAAVKEICEQQLEHLQAVRVQREQQRRIASEHRSLEKTGPSANMEALFDQYAQQRSSRSSTSDTDSNLADSLDSSLKSLYLLSPTVSPEPPF